MDVGQQSCQWNDPPDGARFFVHSSIAQDQPGASGQNYQSGGDGAEAEVRQCQVSACGRGDDNGKIAWLADLSLQFQAGECEENYQTCLHEGLSCDGAAVAAMVPNGFHANFAEPG